MFGSSLRPGDHITITYNGKTFKKVVQSTAPFGFDCFGDHSKYVYFTDGTNLQPDDGATFEVTNHDNT